MNSSIFQINHLRYKTILQIDSLTIPERTVTCLVGRSGSGKTTLLKMLNNLLSPDSGTIRYGGRPLTEWDPIELRRSVVMMGQSPVVFPGTVRDNLLAGLRFSGKNDADDRRLQAMLAAVNLDKELAADASQLSGGEQQRVCLGRVMLMDPPVLLLDEPSSALDEETTQLIMRKLTDAAKQNGKTLIMVTHTMAVVRAFAENIVRIQQGRILGGGVNVGQS
ncbi:MAG: ATP-binding cassette domain-containing protein [Sporolactobacillus sp.]|jgi:putative ABC transport system ATP-binding protein|nr:ATP-binding cassette domain-containing protein [Sporolactobacillus sp.]